MKNQYYGDVNDYRKYGLLRGIRNTLDVNIGVCWMLTPDDNRTDGKFIDYLHHPSNWQHFDPTLYKHLQ